MSPMSAKDIAAAFDERAATYDQSDMHRWLAEEVRRVAGSPPGSVVLDVAGGTGLAARGVQDGQSVVLDLSLGMLTKARAAGVRAVVAGDAHHLPFRDSTFDLVTCVSALPYIADPVTAASEWHRVCRRSGRAVVTAWAEDGITFPCLLRQAAAEHGIPVEDPNAPLGSETRLTALLHRVGFTAVEVQRQTYVAEQDPDLAWTTALDYDMAPALAAAPAQVRDAVRQRFLASVRGAAEASFTTLIAVARRDE
jgi:ubiquinone/menaquinone biosynthesis C-methylase UbiE